MTATTQSTRATRRRAWTAWIVFAVSGAAFGAGILWWWFQPPRVPDVPLESLEPELAQAVIEARAAVLEEPRSGDTWGTLGRVLLANELHPEISYVCFLNAERFEPDNPRWPYFTAIALANQGKRPQGLPKLERAVALEAQSERPQATPRLMLAETLLAADRPDAAETHFQQVFANDPNNVRARFGLAMVMSAREEWTLAREHLQACLGSPQARKKACAQLAMVCRRVGDAKSAQHFSSLESRMPKDFDWSDPFVLEHSHLSQRKRHRFRAVEQLESAGRLEPAAGILKEMVRDYPDDDMPHLMLGRVAAQLGDFRRADYHLHKALELAPDKFQPHYLISLAYLRRGETLLAANDEANRPEAIAAFEKSVQAARNVLARRPDYGFAHMALGLALKNLDKKSEALAAFRQAVHCNPEFAENHLHLGISLAEEGKLAEARPYLEQAALLADPNDPRPRFALDKFYKTPLPANP